MKCNTTSKILLSIFSPSRTKESFKLNTIIPRAQVSSPVRLFDNSHVLLTKVFFLCEPVRYINYLGYYNNNNFLVSQN